MKSVAPPKAGSANQHGNPQQPQQKKNKSQRLSYTSRKSSKYGLVWERDEDVIKCRGCLTSFSLINRRHHCRACGKIFCGTCSSERASVRGSSNAKRVCKWCKLTIAPMGFNRLSLESSQNDATLLDNSSSEEESTDSLGKAARILSSDALKEILQISGNDQCVDCNAPGPKWASLSHGTLLCLHCSGRHRSYGVHISFVRSLKLDKWDDTQRRAMMLGGNRTFWDFVTAPVVEDERPGGETWIMAAGASKSAGHKVGAATSEVAASSEEKWAASAEAYQSPRCVYYRKRLHGLVNGQELPATEPPRFPLGSDTPDVATSSSLVPATLPPLTEIKEDKITGVLTASEEVPSASYSVNEDKSILESRTRIVTKEVRESRRPKWAADESIMECMHCGLTFTVFRRRHHCRKCGDCVCSSCAPGDNTRPIPEMGYTEDVRVCLRCFCPPSRKMQIAADTLKSKQRE